MSEPVNKYEIFYGGNPDGGFSKSSLQCSRIIYATSEQKVLDYCEVRWPNLPPIHRVVLVDENIDTRDI